VNGRYSAEPSGSRATPSPSDPTRSMRTNAGSGGFRRVVLAARIAISLPCILGTGSAEPLQAPTSPLSWQVCQLASWFVACRNEPGSRPTDSKAAPLNLSNAAPQANAAFLKAPARPIYRPHPPKPRLTKPRESIE
jgi:hypothetical protein